MPNGNNDDADDDQNGTTETVEREVIEEHNPNISPEVEALATFAEQEGPLSFRIIPAVVGNGETDWRLNVYSAGSQGPLLQSREGLSDAARQKFGVSVRLQERINSALAYAGENLQVPPELGNLTREKRSLHDLEVLMQEQEA